MLFAQSTAERVITSLKDSEKSKEDLEMLYKGCQMELEKKDKIIDEIEDLCIRKSDDEGEEYGGVIICNFAHKIMDIIKKGK